MPFLRRINSTSNKIYGSRTLLFLKSDGTLKILVIELSLPHPDGDQYGCIRSVYTPAEQGVESSIWQLAKAYVAVNDSGNHQLISHWYNSFEEKGLSKKFIIHIEMWFSDFEFFFFSLCFGDRLNTHAVIEPVIIAANRQLSTVHPIYKLLQPHFRDTMYINAIGRGILLNARGVIESTVFPARYALGLSSAVYKDWVFPDQALPADLIKR